MPTAADVPNKFDCVINGQGYLCADMQDVKGEFVLSPIFIPRQNTQGDYGDDQQDFWMTYTQRDWSLGEQQRYQGRDDDAKRRYWIGTNVDVSEAGKVALRPLTTTTSAFGGAVREMAGDQLNDTIYAASSTNLYEINSAGTVTDRGAHGAGAQPLTMTTGGAFGMVYMSSTDVGSVGVRRWTGVGFGTFSATGSNALVFLNNALYGIDSVGGRLIRYDTAGVVTSIFTWRDAVGGSTGYAAKNMFGCAFGGKLVIVLGYDTDGPSLWVYDGTAPALAGRFPNGFVPFTVTEFMGQLFFGGLHYKRLSSATYVRPTIYYYASGTWGTLWRANSYVVSTSAHEPAVCSFQGGLVFNDDTLGALMFYDPSAGGVSTLGTYTVTDKNPRLVATRDFFLHSREATTPYRHPADGFSTTATVTTSLADFDSSLTKLFRGIKVEFDSASDGNGGSVDISYRVGDVDGSYTSLQTGAASGTEYILSGVTGRSLSVKVTLNKGTSTAGPVLKRIAVRAAPQLPTGPSGAGFRKFTLVLDLHGVKAPLEGQMMRLRDDTVHNKSGAEMATNLFTAAASTSPISVTTELHGTISTMLVDQENFKVQRVRKNEYLAYVPLREV